jgi:hypothetical protein
VLILLSSIVAVAGYVVQSRLRDKERKRSLKLDRVRMQLSDFVGPCSVLSNCFYLSFFRAFAARALYHPFMGSTTDPRCFPANSISLNEMSNGRIQLWWETIGFNVQTLVNGSFNAMGSWVGPEVEEEIRNNPDAELSKQYFRQVRFLFKRFIKPQALLYTKYGGHLVLLGDVEDFKTKYPSAAGSGWLRNLFILQFILWANEFEDIVFPCWDKNDYSLLFPSVNPFPIQLGMYLTRMITSLRELEAKLGTAEHKVHSTNKDMRRGGAGKPQTTKGAEKDEVVTMKKGGGPNNKEGTAQVRQRYVASANKDDEHV